MSKEKTSSNLIKIFLLVILLVLGWNSWKITEVELIASRVDKYNQGVIDEVGKVTGTVKAFSEDLNEIRRFLLLPEKKYFENNQTDTTANTEEKESSTNSQAVFAMLDSMVKEEMAAKNTTQAQPVFDALFTNSDFIKKITETQLRFGEKVELQIKFNDSKKTMNETQQNVSFDLPLYNLIFAPQENVFKVQSALGEEIFKDYSSPDFFSKLADYLTKNANAVREKKAAEILNAATESEKAKKASEADLAAKKKELEDMIKDKAFTETLATLGLKVAEKPRGESNKYIFDVLDATGRIKFSLALELSSGMMKVIRDNQETDINSFLDSAGLKKKP